MDAFDEKIQLNNLLIHFPIFYSNFISLVFSDLGENTPKIHIGVMFLLREHGPLPISHIGEKLSVAKPNMTAVIDSLEEKGWIMRNISPGDRRVIIVDLTDSGSAYLEDISSKLSVILNDRLSSLSREEKQKLMEVLDFLISLESKVLNKL